MRRKLTFLIIALCLVMGNTAHAEQNHSPLILFITGQHDPFGDFWALDAPGQPLRQLTQGGYHYTPVMSPDASYVAYDTVPKIAIPPDRSGWPPFDIWVLNIATGE